MDPYWPSDGHGGGAAGHRSPTRRKARSKSGAGSRRAQDPVLELMMCALMQRQSTSNSGATINSSSSGAATKQRVPVSQVITHSTSDPAPAAACAPAAAAAGAPGNCCCRLWQRLWFKVLVAVLLLAAIAVAIAVPVAVSRAAAARRRMLPPQHALGPRLSTDGMALVFAEDFTQFDASVWNYDIGDGSDYGLKSWGNYEQQCYTASPNNVDVTPHPEYQEEDGVLRIRPVYSETPLTCLNRRAPSSLRQWTSGKVDTKNKVAFSWAGPQVYKGAFAGRVPSAPAAAAAAAAAPGVTRRALLAAGADTGAGARIAGSSSGTAACGRIVVESRMKLPVAVGRWSALWMMPLPQPCPAGSPATAECGWWGAWPASGEMDIVEQVNTDREVLGTIHLANRAGYHQYLGGKMQLSEAALLDWNIYQLALNCSSISWYVNSQQMFQVNKPDIGSSVWPFDEPFFLILNTAIGGLLTGSATPDTAQSRPLLVDYVRVYAQPGPAAP